jgi:predicted transcriptional regulator
MMHEEKVFIQGRPLPPMPKFSDEELLELYRRGLTDREISENLGVTQAAVNYRREKLELENNFRRNTFSDDELFKLYNRGFNDREISEALDVTQAAINYRRGRLGLRTNYIRERAFLTMYKKGLPAEEIATELDAPLHAVIHMMEKYEVVPEKAAAEVET